MTKTQKYKMRDIDSKDKYNLYDWLIDVVGLSERNAQDIWNEKYEEEHNSQNLNCFV